MPSPRQRPLGLHLRVLTMKAMTNNDSKLHGHLAHLEPHADAPIVFFTVTTYRRRRLLNCQEAHDVLLNLWTRSGAHDGWFVGDYLLMPDHVHFFARFGRDSKSMAEWVKMWKSVSTRALDKDSGMAVWQPDYFDRFLRSGESYSEKWAYVQNNPVRAGLVAQADDWPFKGRIHLLLY